MSAHCFAHTAKHRFICTSIRQLRMADLPGQCSPKETIVCKIMIKTLIFIITSKSPKVSTNWWLISRLIAEVELCFIQHNEQMKTNVCRHSWCPLTWRHASTNNINTIIMSYRCLTLVSDQYITKAGVHPRPTPISPNPPISLNLNSPNPVSYNIN